MSRRARERAEARLPLKSPEQAARLTRVLDSLDDAGHTIRREGGKMAIRKKEVAR